MEMMARVAVIGRLGWGWRICSQFTQVAPGQGSCRRRECPHERAAGFPGASALGAATEKCGTFPRQLPEVTRQHFCFIPFTGGESRRPAHTPGKAGISETGMCSNTATTTNRHGYSVLSGSLLGI